LLRFYWLACKFFVVWYKTKIVTSGLYFFYMRFSFETSPFKEALKGSCSFKGKWLGDVHSANWSLWQYHWWDKVRQFRKNSDNPKTEYRTRKDQILGKRKGEKRKERISVFHTWTIWYFFAKSLLHNQNIRIEYNHIFDFNKCYREV